MGVDLNYFSENFNPRSTKLHLLNLLTKQLTEPPFGEQKKKLQLGYVT